jgi:hypothetical protein
VALLVVVVRRLLLLVVVLQARVAVAQGQPLVGSVVSCLLCCCGGVIGLMPLHFRATAPVLLVVLLCVCWRE